MPRKLEKKQEMKKKTITVTVTYLLISKTGSSVSLSELSSMTELTRVQAQCQRHMNASVDLYCSAFSSFFFFFLLFFFDKKLSQQLYIHGLLSDDAYQTIIYNQDLNITEPYTKKNMP